MFSGMSLEFRGEIWSRDRNLEMAKVPRVGIEISKNDWALGHPPGRLGKRKGVSKIGDLGCGFLEAGEDSRRRNWRCAGGLRDMGTED